MTRYRIINTETRILVGIEHDEQAANRRVGELNRRVGSTMRFAWQSYSEHPLDVEPITADHIIH